MNIKPQIISCNKRQLTSDRNLAGKSFLNLEIWEDMKASVVRVKQSETNYTEYCTVKKTANATEYCT